MGIGSKLKKAVKSISKTANDILGDKVYEAAADAQRLYSTGMTKSQADDTRESLGLKAPDLPLPEDPAAAAQAATDEATALANKRTASRRRSLRNQSLLATGSKGVTSTAPTASLLAQGKATLGA